MEKLEKQIKRMFILNIITYIVCFLTLIVSVISYLDSAKANNFVDNLENVLTTPSAETYEEKNAGDWDVSGLIGNLGDD